MKKSERQKARDRIADAIINGKEPNPEDVDLAKRSTKGGRPTGTTPEQFYKMVDFACIYLSARKTRGMSQEEAFEFAINDMEFTIELPTLYKYCSYLRSGEYPEDPQLKWYLTYCRAIWSFIDMPELLEIEPRVFKMKIE